MSDFTHTQFWDKSGGDDPCGPGDHNYVFDKDGLAVCSRCGETDVGFGEITEGTPT